MNSRLTQGAFKFTFNAVSCNKFQRSFNDFEIGFEIQLNSAPTGTHVRLSLQLGSADIDETVQNERKVSPSTRGTKQPGSIWEL
jgi:hypothetical protein